MAFTKTDARVYAALESAKGSLASAYKTAEQFVTWSHATDKIYVPGVAGLGSGIWKQKNTGTTFQIQDTLDGRMTLQTLPSIIFLGDHTKATTGAGPDYTHVYTPIDRNSELPYMSLGLVWGEQGTLGAGAMTRFTRDTRIVSREITVDSEDVLKFTIGFGALNEGAGAGTETFAADTGIITPQPNGPSANVYTYPSFAPAGMCVNDFKMTWTPNVVYGKACLGSGEKSDILIDEAGWTIAFTAIADSNITQLYNQINYLKNTGLSIDAAMNAAIKEGAFSFLINSTDVIPTSSTPYSFAGNFPNLQWNKINWNTNQTPQTVTFEATSFVKAHTFTFINDKISTAMNL
jgi:hypothetical protein